MELITVPLSTPPPTPPPTWPSLGAEFPTTVQLITRFADAPPPCSAEFPATRQFTSVPDERPPPDTRAKLFNKTQFVSDAEVAPPPSPVRAPLGSAAELPESTQLFSTP